MERIISKISNVVSEVKSRFRKELRVDVSDIRSETLV